MFKIVSNTLSDGSTVFDVTGEIGGESLTVGARSEIHACEIARALNEAAAIAIDRTPQLSAADLHPELPAMLTALAADARADRERARDWRDFDTRR